MSESDVVTIGAAAVGLAVLLWSSASWGKVETRNIYDQQRSNRRWSLLLVGVFALFVGVLGLGLDVFLLRMPVPALGLNVPDNPFPFGTKLYWDYATGSGSPMGVPWATAAAVGISFFIAYASFRNAPRLVLAAAQARNLDPNNPKEQQLMNVVRELAVAAGLPMPSVYVVPDSDLNAFATGTDPEHAHVAVTQGLLEQLNREELQGVLAHELSHVRNADVELMAWVVALAGTAALLSDWAGRGMRASSSSRSGRSKGGGAAAAAMFLVWILFVMLAPLVSRLMALAVSRRREYLADASGAELTRNPLSLAKALEKIHASLAPTAGLAADSFAHLCIEDPKGSALNGWEGFWGDLLSTHPPIAKRIAALKEMAYLYAPRSA